MRRIFGGASLNLQPSQSSDSLSSPSPSITNGRTDLSYPISPANEKKSWISAAVNGVAGSIRSGGARHQQSSSTTSSAASTSQDGGGGASRSIREDQEDTSPFQLLSNSSRLQSPATFSSASYPTAARNGHSRTSSRSQSGSGQPRATGGQATGGAFLPVLEGGEEMEATLGMGSGKTPGEEKDAIMVELLSGQAVVEAREYAIMEWEEMESTKKEHLILASRIASLSRSLALETRLRDSVAKLVRLSSPADSSGRTSASRLRVTKEQAEAQLVLANEKIAKLSTELYKTGWSESELRTKLLQHTAGVLALAVRRKEEEEAGLAPSPLPPSASSSSLLPAISTTPSSLSRATSPSFAPSPPPRQSDRFEGHHFFAGNKDAIVPLPRSPSLNSPQLISASSNTFPSIDATIVRQLEAQVAELRSNLAIASAPVPREDVGQLEKLRAEVLAAREAEETVCEEAASSRRAVEELQVEIGELRKDVEISRDEVRGADDATAALRRKMGELEIALDEARGRAVGAEQRIIEVEDEIGGVKARYEREAMQLQAVVSQLESSAAEKGEREVEDEGRLQSERQKVVQAIGDILRRHRTRPTLGPTIRDLPAFDDTTNHADLPSYLASTLDAHFDRLTNHVSSLSDELASTLEEHSHAQSDVQIELKQAVDHRERWRSEAETHRREKEKLESAQADLESRIGVHEERLASLPALEQNLDLAAAEEARLRQELVVVQARATAVDSQLADAMAQQSKTLRALQELWRTIPPVEARVASSHSDDLAVLKAAFEITRRPVGNFLSDAAASKFTVDGLVERIRVLLVEDAKLVQKLVAFEATQVTHKGTAERAQKMLGEREKQVNDLEEQMRISSVQDVAMLERLNDLTESLEQTRGEKRKLEAVISSAQSQARTLEEDKSRLTQSLAVTQDDLARLSARPDNSVKVEKLESDLQDVRDQLADAEEELDDAKKREQKQRGQLLDELSLVQQEVSSLKTQLRQEQRKKAK